MYDKHYVGLDLTGFQDNGIQRPVSRVTLKLDDNNVLTAGDDTGLEIISDCPHATQEMVNALLAQIKGTRYQMFNADDARIDPAAELGDGITAGGVYSVISRISDDGSGFPGVTAPGEAELDDEYPAGGPMTQEFNRKIAQTNSRITKTAEQIRLEVENEVKGLNAAITVELNKITQEVNDVNAGLSNKIEQTASDLTTRITNTAAGLENEIRVTADSLTTKISATDGRVTSLSAALDGVSLRVQGAEGNIGQLNLTATNLQSQITATNGSVTTLSQKVDSFTISVSNGETSSTIKLLANGAEIASQNISMSGLVTIAGLSGGTTTIDGACIKTGKINADRLELTGKITFTDLDSSAQGTINGAVNSANSALTAANNAQSTVSGWTYGDTTYIDGSKLMTGTVVARTLEGEEIKLMSEFMGEIQEIGSISLVPTSSQSPFKRVEIGSGNIALKANDSIDLRCIKDGTGIQILNNGNVTINGNVFPGKFPEYSLGNSIARWKDIYLANSPIVTSDRTKKEDISYDLSTYTALFDALRPASFRYIDGQSGRTHLGMISQDVEEALKKCGISSTDFAGFIKSPREDGGYDYALRYGEFIALCIHKIQLLETRIAELERRTSQ